MKRLVIVCEGPTEQEFVKSILQPYLLQKQVYIQTPLIKKSGGGIIPWEGLRSQINTHLKDSNSIVTTLIDYYGIPYRFEYPGWMHSIQITDKSERIDFLEQEMSQEIDEKSRHRFIPYYQLHEFEGLLFNNIAAFDATFEQHELLDRDELENIIKSFPNPELINDNSETAPSKRLEKLIEGYNKVIYGSILAENIGMHNLRLKSPRFNKWIEKLEGI